MIVSGKGGSSFFKYSTPPQLHRVSPSPLVNTRQSSVKLSSVVVPILRSSVRATANPRLSALSRQLSTTRATMAPVTKEVDFLVIGGGSGGLACARRASGQHGAKTIAIENKFLGGTCVNVGCVPKKITWTAAAMAETIHDAKHYGFSFEQTAPFDWTAFTKKRTAYVRRLNGIYEKNLNNDKVEYLRGTARLTGPNQAVVQMTDKSETTINAKKILIATGGHPTIPQDIPGSEHGITSDGFFELEKQPKRVGLVGAGYIAVELAGMMNALGSETHLFIRGDSFLRTFDPMVQEKLVAEYERQGIHIHRQSSQQKVDKNGDKLTMHYKDDKSPDGTTVELDSLIWAIGRSPEVEGLGLDKAGVTQNKKGQVVVDDYQNTNVDNVYALGDVCGRVELTPVAIAAGRKLADRLFGGPQFKESKLDYNDIPSVVFAHPTVGSIGLTEPQAREKYGDANIKVYSASFTNMYYAMMDEAKQKGPTSYKLIVSGKEEKIVGMHLLGIASDEIMQGFGVAVKMGATKKDFDSCVAIHPTAAEELVTMK